MHNDSLINGISIIICSISEVNAIKISKSIRETIGFDEYEILIFNNKIRNESIANVYNQQSKIAQYSILLFIHEDCVFVTQNWGQILLDLYVNDSIGGIGVAGSKLKLKSPSYWSCTPKEYHVKNIYQNGIKESIGFTKNNLEKVAVLDGVFLSCRNIKDYSPFSRIKGFHGYDIDFSIKQIINNKQNFATNLIEINHFSKGNKNCAWLDSLFQISSCYGSYLPINTLNNSFRPSLENDTIEKNFHISCDLKCWKSAKKFYLLYKFTSFRQKLIWLKRLLKLKLLVH